jgi:hypothetical protein
MNLRLLNFVLAVFWVAVGVGMLAEWYTAEQPRFVLPFAPGVSAGWVALAFAAYNLVRWYALRSRSAAPPPSPNALNRPARREPQEYHPEFDFDRPTDPPA